MNPADMWSGGRGLDGLRVARLFSVGCRRQWFQGTVKQSGTVDGKTWVQVEYDDGDVYDYTFEEFVQSHWRLESPLKLPAPTKKGHINDYTLNTWIGMGVEHKFVNGPLRGRHHLPEWTGIIADVVKVNGSPAFRVNNLNDTTKSITLEVADFLLDFEFV
jgi:hypothetical protein